MHHSDYIQAVQQWVKTIVIDLNLCPFAADVYMRNAVRFKCSEATSAETLLLHLHDELLFISQEDQIETTLLIHPYVLNDFDAYNQFLQYADDLLDEMKLSGQFQIASFHPDYQFADSEFNDVDNFTNRSPYPILHILDEQQLENAIATYPDTTNIPERNKKLMQKIGAEKMKGLLQACFTKGRKSL